MSAHYDIAEICYRLGVRTAVISPGSRSAPITISFAKHDEIKTRVVSDERSAGFIALGIALETDRPVALICTSGTAGLNYTPAITEALYQRIPLIAITADRPPEWTDQGDGQTIRQNGMLNQHTKKSFQLPADIDNENSQWQIQRQVSEAVNLAAAFPAGPVHINVPIREPFYPENDEAVVPSNNIKVIRQLDARPQLDNRDYFLLSQEMKLYNRVMVVVGQGTYSNELNLDLDLANIPIIADCIANIHRSDNIVKHHDIFLAPANKDSFKDLQPELVISLGGAVLSKNLKTFLRNHKPEDHWHIQAAGEVPDVFQSLTKVIRADPNDFFKNFTYEAQDSAFLADWLFEENKSRIYINSFMREVEFGEFEATKVVLDALPPNSKIHLGNSMPVRYANMLPTDGKRGIQQFANRGTSGIDGSLSTAVGACTASKLIHTILLGDMSFFYDRNALWNNNLPPNLRIIILNNHGGGIFEMIDGPNHVKELEEYFVTEQKLTARHAAEEHGLEYHHCDTKTDLISTLIDFYKASDQPKILEITTDRKVNLEVLKKFKQLNHYGL